MMDDGNPNMPPCEPSKIIELAARRPIGKIYPVPPPSLPAPTVEALLENSKDQNMLCAIVVGICPDGDVYIRSNDQLKSSEAAWMLAVLHKSVMQLV